MFINDFIGLEFVGIYFKGSDIGIVGDVDKVDLFLKVLLIVFICFEEEFRDFVKVVFECLLLIG